MTTSDETDIRRLEDERFDAVLRGDMDTFIASAHPDLTYVHSNGTAETLTEYVEKCRRGFYDYHRIEHPITEIAIHGDVALVFGEMQADLDIDGARKHLDNVSLAVWVRTSDGWKLRAYQPTARPAT